MNPATLSALAALLGGGPFVEIPEWGQRGRIGHCGHAGGHGSSSHDLAAAHLDEIATDATKVEQRPYGEIAKAPPTEITAPSPDERSERREYQAEFGSDDLLKKLTKLAILLPADIQRNQLKSIVVTQSRSVWRSMPQASAAASREQ